MPKRSRSSGNSRSSAAGCDCLCVAFLLFFGAGPLPAAARALRLPGAPQEEVTLVAALTDATPKVDAALDMEDFAAAMTALAGLRKPVDAFFDEVMVNSSVPEERDNRLRLLIQVRDLMGRVADFSQVSG